MQLARLLEPRPRNLASKAIDGNPSEMPAWGPRLSREQIWSLVYYIEHESRGILGDFPPGLYPERRDTE